MLGVVLLKGGQGFPRNTVMDFTSGVVGSTTMVLPGISGSYMLLVLDQYDRVVGAVRDMKDALKGRNATALKASLAVVVPVGIGAVLGIVALSNVLKILLRRCYRPTVGVLLGILLGSVIGLWPFSQSVGEKALEDRSFEEIQAYAAHWQIPDCEGIAKKELLIDHLMDRNVWEQGTPPAVSGAAVSMSLLLVAAGFGATFALSRLGVERARGKAATQPARICAETDKPPRC